MITRLPTSNRSRTPNPHPNQPGGVVVSQTEMARKSSRARWQPVSGRQQQFCGK